MSRVALIFSPTYAEALSRLPIHSKREMMTFSLLQYSGILQHLSVIAPEKASTEDLERFHTRKYIEALQAEEGLPTTEAMTFGLVDDAYSFPGMFEYCHYVAGASLTAAKLLCSQTVDVAINWGGGRHHAKKDQASGFCYVNDIVLAVDYLLRQHLQAKVLVIDIDIHHGDGVEEAFYFSSRVFTLSFHKLARGFFPGTGASSSTGQGAGRYRNLNVPLDDGITDEQFLEVFELIVEPVVDAFQPTYIVMTCGVDTLSTDPLGTFNLTSTGVTWCVEVVREFQLPLLLLGGGGYCEADAARCFAAVTAALVDQELPMQVPDHDFLPQ